MPKTPGIFCEGVWDSFGNRLKTTKQVSNDLFCQFQTCRIDILFRVRVALDVRIASVVLQSNIYGEFDPGSGRTLAACLTHASRTMTESLLF